MFDRLFKKDERRREKAQAEVDRAAATSDLERQHDERRARDLPDPLGDFNEAQGTGPVINPGP